MNDLEAELEEEEQEDLDRELLKVSGPNAADSLPEVPTAEVPKPAKPVAAPKKAVAAGGGADDDDDMAELAAWAS